MNTLEIDQLVRSDKLLRNYKGTFSRDTLPDLLDPKGIYIVNSSPQRIAVGHWICVLQMNFFCSYGLHPDVYGIEGMRQYNGVQLQSISSTVCGYYVAMVIKLWSRGFNLADILDNFTDSCNINDDIIRLYYNL
jgi:hypothetical protein